MSTYQAAKHVMQNLRTRHAGKTVAVIWYKGRWHCVPDCDRMDNLLYAGGELAGMYDHRAEVARLAQDLRETLDQLEASAKHAGSL